MVEGGLYRGRHAPLLPHGTDSPLTRNVPGALYAGACCMPSCAFFNMSLKVQSMLAVLCSPSAHALQWANRSFYTFTQQRSGPK